MSNLAPFYLNWTVNGIQEVGNSFNTEVYFDISVPGDAPNALSLSVSSSALEQKTYNTLTNVKMYLIGDSDSIQIVQTLWPGLGNTFSPPRTDLNGGLQISFDGGSNYTMFDTTYGYKDDPNTWIIIPAISIGTSGTDGILTAFDVSTFIIKYIIPTGAVEYRKLKIGIGLDFDII